MGIAEGFVTLVLPLLAKGAAKGAETLADRVGADVAEGLTTAWGRIWRKLRGRPEAVATADRLARDPNDEDAAAALTAMVSEELRADADLAGQVLALVGQAGIVVTGGAGGVNVVGDHNTVKQGRFVIDIGQAGNVTIGD